MLLRMLALLVAGLPLTTGAITPRVAWHEHLVSPSTAHLLGIPGYDGAALLRDLDRAGIPRGVVLSMGYTYADERKHVPDPDPAVRAENDWTADQIARSHGRLIGFCSVNPLRDAAEAEIRRCTRLPQMHGLKLHFANSGVSLRVPAQAAKLRRIFALADRLRLPIVVHMHARTGTVYGAEDAALFLDDLLSAAPHIDVQIAHLAGSGEFPPDTQAAIQVFADAIARRDPRTAHLYFDLTSAAMPDSTPADGERIARAIRSVGLQRILFGTDLPVGGNPAPAASWALFRAKVPLTEAEWRRIADNRASYLVSFP